FSILVIAPQTAALDPLMVTRASTSMVCLLGSVPSCRVPRQNGSGPLEGMAAVDGIKQKMCRLFLPGQLEACVLDYFACGVLRYTRRFAIVLVDKTHR